MRNSCRHSKLSIRDSAPSRGTGIEVAGLFEEILGDDSLLRVKVTGRSMRPFLRGGETLTIRRTPHSSLRRGDLVLFKNRQGLPVVHRIVRMTMRDDGAVTFETKGDALLTTDGPVDGSDILGKVSRIEATRTFDMNAAAWRAVNYLLAAVSLLRSRVYLALRSSVALLRRCKPCGANQTKQS